MGRDFADDSVRATHGSAVHRIQDPASIAGRTTTECVHCGRAASRHDNTITCAWCELRMTRCQDAQAPNGWRVRVWQMERTR